MIVARDSMSDLESVYLQSPSPLLSASDKSLLVVPSVWTGSPCDDIVCSPVTIETFRSISPVLGKVASWDVEYSTKHGQQCALIDKAGLPTLDASGEGNAMF